MGYSPRVGCDVRSGNEMETVYEETLEFNGADSDGIWNVAAVGAS